MLTPLDRTFIRLLIYAFTAATSLLAVGLVMLIGGGGSSVNGVRNLWCVPSPASFFDWAIHSWGFGASLLGLVAVLAALRAVRQERAAAAELCSMTRAARLQSIPGNVGTTADAAGVVDSLDVVDASRPFAFVYGWLRPRICVSTGMVARLTDREFEAVLYHERWHLLRRDPVRLFVVRTITAAFAFIPAIHRLAPQYRLATEIAADHYAVATMGSQRWLAGALMKLVSDEGQTPGVAFLGLAEARIAALSGDFPSERHGRTRLALLLLLGEVMFISMLFTSRGSSFLTAFPLHLVC